MHSCLFRLSCPFLTIFCFKIWSFHSVFVKIAFPLIWGWRVGLYNVLHGEAPTRSRGPTPTRLYTINFDRKGTPFVYLYLNKGTPFTRIHNWTVLWINRPKMKSCHFHVLPGAHHELLVVLNKIHDTAIKCACSKCFNLRPFEITKWQISLPFHIAHLVKFLPIFLERTQDARAALHSPGG